MEYLAIVTDVKGNALKVNKKTLEVFTVPGKELRDYLFLKGHWFDSLLDFWEIKEVELTDNGIHFIFWSFDRCLDATPAEEANPAELNARGEAALNAIMDRVKSGEITATEAVSLMEQEPHSNGIHVLYLDEDEIFAIIHDMRFPSFWGSFFKIEAWAEPGAYQKITKAELTNDGVEFTIVQTRVP